MYKEKVVLSKLEEEMAGVPAEYKENYLRLMVEIAAQESTGQFNTVHHEALHNIQVAIAAKQGEITND